MFIWFLPYREWMCQACLILAKRRINSAYRVRYAQTRHHRADHLRTLKDYLRIEKDYLRLGKTIYSFKKPTYGFEVFFLQNS